VNNIIEGVGLVDGDWLLYIIGHKVVDESSTLFWRDPWLDGVSLNVSFSRLYELSEND